MTKQSKKSHTKQMNKRMLPNKKSSLLTVLHGETNQTIYLFGNIRKNNQNEFFFHFLHSGILIFHVFHQVTFSC